MFRPPRTSRTKAAVALSCACFFPWSAARGQNFTTQVASPDPLGFYGVLPVGDGFGLGLGPSSLGDGLKGGLTYGVELLTVYDNNFFLQESGTKSEMTALVTPKFNYTSDPEGGARYSLVANYTPAFRGYWHNSDLNGVDNSGDVTFHARGSKSELTAYLRYSELAGTDRLTGQFVNGALFTTGLEGNYQVAPRTSVFASWSMASSDYQDSGLIGSDIFTTNVGAFWSATERLAFGPSVRYILSESDNTGSRDAWSLNFQARYKAGERMQFLASIGLETAKSSRDSGDTTGLTGNLTALYAINDRLVWRNSIEYVTVPSPDQTNFVVNNFSYSSSLERQLTRGTIGVGIDLNLSQYEGVGPVGASPEDEENISAFITYRRKFFLDRLQFETELRYTENNGGTDWDQLRINAGVEVQF